jgi:hypothetical protein
MQSKGIVDVESPRACISAVRFWQPRNSRSGPFPGNQAIETGVSLFK